jgi:opacity protein-like surface antigen
MGRTTRCLALSAVGLLVPSIAIAQTGPYIVGAAGLNRVEPLLASQGTTEIGTDLGPVGLGALGWSFGNGWRAEVEGSYRSGGIASIATVRDPPSGPLVALTGTSGTVSTEAVMVNVDYDIPLAGLGLPVEPYIGGGVGYGRIDVSGGGDGFGKIPLSNGSGYVGPTLVSFGSASAFAYQAIAGVSMPLAAMPGLSAVLEYRYFGTARADVPIDRVAAFGGAANGAIDLHNGVEVHDNTIMLGVRYSFGGS